MKRLLITILAFCFHFSYAQNNNRQITIGCKDSDEVARSFIVNNKGNYVVVGEFDGACIYTDSSTKGSVDAWILEVDALSNKIWSKTMGGSKVDRFNKIIQTRDRGYAIIGETDSDIDSLLNKGSLDFWIIKLDSIGNVEWQHTYGGSDFDRPTDIIETANDHLMIAGFSASKDGDVINSIGGNADGWVLKLNSQGNTIWKKCYGSTKTDLLNSILEAGNNRYLLTGSSTGSDNDIVQNNRGWDDVWLLSIDDVGQVLWSKTYGSTSMDVGEDAVLANNGGYLIAGFTESVGGDISYKYGGGQDIWLLKVNVSGDLEWEKCYGGSRAEGFKVKMINSKEGGYIFSASTNSDDKHSVGKKGAWDILCIKIDDAGLVKWHKTYGGLGVNDNNNIHQLADSSYVLSATITAGGADVINYYGQFDSWLFQITKEGSTNTPAVEGYYNNDLIKVYPTVTNNEITLEITAPVKNADVQLIDIKGTIVYRKLIPHAEGLQKLDLSSLSTGLYILQLRANEDVVHYKLIKQ